jgi:hydroxyquinol 1,2-dioxygenase
LLGPFYRQDSPTLEPGQSIAENCPGEEIGVYGRVIGAMAVTLRTHPSQSGKPDENGFYDLQKLATGICRSICPES